MAASKAESRIRPGPVPLREPQDEARWDDPQRRARVRRRIVYWALAGVLAAEIVGAFVWIAASHYDRGRQALKAGIYATAVDEFSAARIFVIPYRDADALREQAQRELATERARSEADAARDAAMAGLLRKASSRVAAGDAAGALALVREARARVPDGPLSAAARTTALADDLANTLAARTRAALGAARWHRASLLAASLLLLSPGDAEGTSLEAQARLGQALQGKLDKAEAAARDGRWRRCLTLALAVVKERPDFPGATSLVARARDALKPKPTAAPPPTAPATPAPVTPTQPPPP